MRRATGTTGTTGEADQDSAPGSGSLFFIGNATVLIRFGGFTILTDPTFIHRHEQVSIGYGMHSTRLTDPAIEINELPALDLVLLSHFHGDHFDQVAERELDKTLPIVTTPEAARELQQRGFHNPHALETWSAWETSKGDTSLKITAMPGRHGPPLSELVLPDVMGSMVEFRSPAGRFRLYITGDTLVFDDIKEIPHRYPQIDLGLLHLGGTRVLGILVTMDDEQGLEMVQLVGADLWLPIHYNDYDVFKSPLADFQRRITERGLESRMRYLSHGDSYEFAVANPAIAGERGKQEQPRVRR
jgi:L-ascorbate metabolism protein UlaG (beta-lactamase superfamily)